MVVHEKFSNDDPRTTEIGTGRSSGPATVKLGDTIPITTCDDDGNPVGVINTVISVDTNQGATIATYAEGGYGCFLSREDGGTVEVIEERGLSSAEEDLELGFRTQVEIAKRAASEPKTLDEAKWQHERLAQLHGRLRDDGVTVQKGGAWRKEWSLQVSDEPPACSAPNCDDPAEARAPQAAERSAVDGAVAQPASQKKRKTKIRNVEKDAKKKNQYEIIAAAGRAFKRQHPGWSHREIADCVVKSKKAGGLGEAAVQQILEGRYPPAVRLGVAGLGKAVTAG